MKTLLITMSFGCILLASLSALANSQNQQLSCTKYLANETNGYPFLQLVEYENGGLIIRCTNETGLSSYYQPSELQVAVNHYILTFKNSESGACPEFSKCYDKILMYLSKSDDDGFVKNGTYKTSQLMFYVKNRGETAHYICRHSGIEDAFSKDSAKLSEAPICKVPPQNDCSKSPKRLCCDCVNGSLQCY